MKQYQIGFKVTAFAHTDHISPARIEERMEQALRSIILDEISYRDKQDDRKVFGYVSNLEVTEHVDDPPVTRRRPGV